MNKKVYFYDLEVFPNFFSATFKSLDNKVRQFVLFDEIKSYRELENLITFLESEVSGLIGFNNLNYDYPLLHFLISLAKNSLITVYMFTDALYKKSQEIINAKFSAVRNPLIPQLDLFRIWHFDNITKATSLKYVECAIRFDNVEDLPFLYDYIMKPEDIQTILDYNLNDVNATEQFYYITLGQHDGRYKGDNKIQLRKDIQKEFGINCLNYNDVKIGEEINKQYYLKKTGKSWWDLKQLETVREIIYIKDLIPSYIEFKTKELQTFLSDISLCSFKVDEKFKRKFEFAGLKIEFKRGGLHAISKDKLIIPKDNEILCEFDVSSLYPATIINQKIYSEHLGLEFLDIYKKVFDLRLSAKKTGNKTVAAALKLSLNGGGFGKMGAKKSWMKDELAMYRVTFCGQLSLLLLIEQYYLANIKVINANTDSITILFNKDKQDVIEKINKDWQEITSYQLEQTVYTKLIQRDINNYLAIKSDKSGNVKQKGCFITEPEVHQNHSQRIVAVALEKYFVNNIPIEDTINDCKDIYDFCCFFKKRENCRVEARGDSTEKLGKTIRYYVSNSGVTLMKIMPPLPKKVKEGKLGEREINIQKGYLCTVFNKYNKKLIEEYDINYQFYISECMKIINNINKI